MAKEYIEREAVVKELQEELDYESLRYTKEQNKHIDIGLGIALRTVKRLPAADVVEVVRCKECKHRVNGWSDGKPCCGNLHAGMTASVELKDDDFCSYGERRGNDGT